MLNKINKLYQLIFDKFKFKFDNSNLSVSLPQQISNEYEIIATKFISDNKDFIISTLKNNTNSLNILCFDLSNTLCPLSFAQERLFFIEKYEEGTNAYNIPMVFKLSGKTSLDILEKSISSIVARHEILRTLIKEDSDGNGYQIVLEGKTHPFGIDKLKITDLLQLDQELSKIVNHIYDLSNEYPIKVCFYELINSKEKETTEYYFMHSNSSYSF